MSERVEELDRVKGEIEQILPSLGKHRIEELQRLISKHYVKRFTGKRKTPKYGSLNKGFTDQQIQAFFMAIDNEKFIVCRTQKHPYMVDPLSEYWGSKENPKGSVFYLDSVDADMIKGKNVGIVDEIVGIRWAMNAMERLVKRSGGRITKRVAMFSDEESFPDITCVGVLPVFYKTVPKNKKHE